MLVVSHPRIACSRGMGYLEAQEGDDSRTAFRKAEKKYKLYKHTSTTSRTRPSKSRSTVPPVDLSEVLDFRKISTIIDDGTPSVSGVQELHGIYGWKVYTLDGHPGFYFIPNALGIDEQFHWIQEALMNFPEPPNRTNHTAEYGCIHNLWSAVQKGCILIDNTESTDRSIGWASDYNGSVGSESENAGVKFVPDYGQMNAIGDSKDSGYLDSTHAQGTLQPRIYASEGKHAAPTRKWKFVQQEQSGFVANRNITADTLLRKLRWATLGIQFDWSKRAYDISLPFKEFPVKLAQLASRLAMPAVNGGPFNAEAAIINYFSSDDMLGGHIDDMEADWSKPIVSMSLGCKAIFLLGGVTREVDPVAMFLRSGDVVLMAGPARSCYHGVPRIFVGEDSELPAFASLAGNSEAAVIRYISQSRININIRQVF